MLPPLIWPPVSLRNERLFKPMSFTATRYCMPSGFLRLRTLIFWPQGCNMVTWPLKNRTKLDETPIAWGFMLQTFADHKHLACFTTHLRHTPAGGIAGSSKAVASPNDQCDGHREHGEQNHLRFATVQDCPSSNSYHQLSSCHVVSHHLRIHFWVPYEADVWVFQWRQICQGQVGGNLRGLKCKTGPEDLPKGLEMSGMSLKVACFMPKLRGWQCTPLLKRAKPGKSAQSRPESKNPSTLWIANPTSPTSLPRSEALMQPPRPPRLVWHTPPTFHIFSPYKYIQTCSPALSPSFVGKLSHSFWRLQWSLHDPAVSVFGCQMSDVRSAKELNRALPFWFHECQTWWTSLDPRFLDFSFEHVWTELIVKWTWPPLLVVADLDHIKSKKTLSVG